MKHIPLKHPILQGNQIMADKNRSRLADHSICMINLMSSPGSGKTSLLEYSLRCLSQQVKIGVIEGDVATTLDAERIASTGVKAVQINTHGACHLDAQMIASAFTSFDLNRLDLLIIENVGNLVCPADFDLGESFRVVMLSTTEGADKVLKYPSVFTYADAVILSKIDLLPHVRFDVNLFTQTMHEINPRAPIFKVSALSGEGMQSWISWLLQKKEEDSM